MKTIQTLARLVAAALLALALGAPAHAQGNPNDEAFTAEEIVGAGHQFFGKMSGDRVAVTSSHEVPLDRILKDGVRTEPDVAALASAADDGSGRVFVMAWHYHDDDVQGPDAAIELNLTSVWIHHLFLGDLLPPPGFHDQLAEAMVGRDPIAADGAIREHVQHGLDRTMERLSPYLKWDQTRLKQLSERSRGSETPD